MMELVKGLDAVDVYEELRQLRDAIDSKIANSESLTKIDTVNLIDEEFKELMDWMVKEFDLRMELYHRAKTRSA